MELTIKRKSKIVEEQCGTYTYKIVKPLLGYIQQLKQEAENNENKDRKIMELQNKVDQLQQNVSANMNKDKLLDLCTSKDNSNSLHIKDLRSTIFDLREIINFQNKTIEQLSSNSFAVANEIYLKEITFKLETINKLNAQIIELNHQINTNDAKYQENENKLKDKNEKIMFTIKEKDDLIEYLNAQLKNITNNMNKNEMELRKCENLKKIKNATSMATMKENEVIIDKLKSQLKQWESIVVSSCIPFQNYPGIHHITVPGIDAFDVLCNSETAGPGWTVIQQRFDGKEDFYRDWAAYREGFGSFDGDFFLGLEKIHRLTTNQRHELYLHIERFNGEITHAMYDHFAIAGEDDMYRLITLGNYSGNAVEDKMRYHFNQQFSTRDMDNDPLANMDCAKNHHGGWWYNKCAALNFNGQFIQNETNSRQAIFYHTRDSLKQVKMLIRPQT